MKILLKATLILLIVLSAIIIVLVGLLIDTHPIVNQSNQINATSAAQSKRLAKRIAYNLKQADEQVQISLQAQEIDGLTALLNRAKPAITSRVLLTKGAALVKVSVRLPQPINQFYINLDTTVLSSSNGIELTKVSIGDMNFAGETAIWLVSKVANFYAGSGTAEKVLASIKQVDIRQKWLVTQVMLDKSLVSTNDEHSLLAKIRDDLALFGDPKLINFYYQALIKHAATLPERVSLDAFIHHLFALALKQNSSVEPSSYVEQNKAILVALVLYFGTDKFELVVGNVEQLALDAKAKRYHHRNKVLLAGRNDLQKHFIYSIALQLLSDNQTSDALGEFKEFLDTNQGGSGFSFVDLLADRAGTRLAMIATFSEQQAKAVQPLLARVHEKDLLPSISNLEEGVGQVEFNEKYHDVNSAAYQKMLTLLDNKLKSLPLYQFNWR